MSPSLEPLVERGKQKEHRNNTCGRFWFLVWKEMTCELRPKVRPLRGATNLPCAICKSL